MKKNNQSGFMLAEAFIVSTVVLGVLVFMFLQIRTIINGYDKSFSYNTIPGIYTAREIKKFIDINFYDSIYEEVDQNGYKIIDSNNSYFADLFETANIKTLVVSDGDVIDVIQDSTISEKFKNYINTLSLSENYKIMIEFNDDTFAMIEGD